MLRNLPLVARLKDQEMFRLERLGRNAAGNFFLWEDSTCELVWGCGDEEWLALGWASRDTGNVNAAISAGVLGRYSIERLSRPIRLRCGMDCLLDC